MATPYDRAETRCVKSDLLAEWCVRRFLRGPVPEAELALTGEKRARHATATISSTVITQRPPPYSRKSENFKKPQKINQLATKRKLTHILREAPSQCSRQR
jgi:hypothetical protein